MPTPIDRYFAAKCVKKEVDAAFKEAEAEAEIYLDEAREKGQSALISTFFGEEAGEYKRGKTRAKTVVKYELGNGDEFSEWCADNSDAIFMYVGYCAKDFCKWWFESTGEVPDGITRVEYEEPPTLKAPQVYRYDHELVKQKLSEGGNLLQGANHLLLGDADG